MHAVANLQHAHIVPLLESDEEDGIPYFTMPFISGKTLQSTVETEAWSLKDAVKLVLRLAGAITHVHEREIKDDDGNVVCIGVLYRDLKPSNVLLDSAREPYVTDFGLAKLMNGSDPNASITGPGAVLGSPSFMAPEQALGRPDMITELRKYTVWVRCSISCSSERHRIQVRILPKCFRRSCLIHLWIRGP